MTVPLVGPQVLKTLIWELLQPMTTLSFIGYILLLKVKKPFQLFWPTSCRQNPVSSHKPRRAWNLHKAEEQCHQGHIQRPWQPQTRHQIFCRLTRTPGKHMWVIKSRYRSTQPKMLPQPCVVGSFWPQGDRAQSGIGHRRWECFCLRSTGPSLCCSGSVSPRGRGMMD